MSRSVRSSLCLFSLVLLLSLDLSSQTKTADNGLSASTLLQQVREKYAQAKTYRIEMVEDTQFSSDFYRQWDKTLVTAVMAPGNKYHFESRGQFGWSAKISDGKTEWVADRISQMHTQKPAPENGPSQPRGLISMNLMGVFNAQSAIRAPSGATRLLDPAYLKDETLQLGGKQVPCYVVTGRGRYTGGAKDSMRKYTLWIDKATLAVRKVHEHVEGLQIEGELPSIEDRTMVYSVADLTPQVFPEDLFKFQPSAEAQLIEEFPDRPVRGKQLIGKHAPDVKLPSPDGKVLTLAEFQGKPLLLDFWATWCAPCVASIPPLEKLFKETSSKGLVFLSIDEDFEAKTAAEAWAKHEQAWTNVHDADGEIQRAFAPGGMPQFVLIDPSGNITYVGVGFDEPALRAAIAKLGPEFSSVNTPSKEEKAIP